MIERILAAVAPSLAASRAEARLRLQVAGRRAKLVQSYDAAQTGGRHSGWWRPSASANTETQTAIRALRDGGRELVRNNPHASRAVRVIVAHVMGSGVRPRAQATGDGAEIAQGIAADRWARFVDRCDPEGRVDFYGQQRQVMRAVVESGEALRLWTPLVEGNRLLWRCRILEGDHLDLAKNEAARDGGRTVQGIEFDAMGRRVAYWLHEDHPGDRYGRLNIASSRRVPAEFVDHIFDPLRPGQVRGVSWFAPVALTLRDLGDLAEAELVRKKLEACIAAIVTNANDDGGTGGIIAPATDATTGATLTSATGETIERMQPGMIVQANPGWDIKYQAPEASEGLVPHMKERLHAVAAGVGCTYVQLSGDLAEANYSSMRSGQIEFERLVDGWQDDLAIMQSGRPAWRRVMDAAVAEGALGFAPAAKWIRPKRPWVDPQADVTANIEAAAAGFISPQDIIERTGEDAGEVLDEIAAWKAALDARGLTVSLGYGQAGGTDAGDA